MPSSIRLVVMCAPMLLAGTSTADACGCVLSPQNCNSLGTADVVFQATVESIELTRRLVDPATLPVGTPPDAVAVTDSRLVRLRDMRALRGEPRTTVLTAAYGNCDYDFQAGSRYLIVADRLPDGRLSVSKCGLTRPLSGASALQEYLQVLQGPATQTRVWGAVFVPSRWNDFGRDVDPVPGSRVTVTGPQQHSILTGVDGRYTFADLPHGTYRMTVDLPGQMPQLGTIPAQVLVVDPAKAHACAELNFIAPIKSLISGQITDQAGKPLEGVFVELGLADQLDRSRGSAGAGIETDANGRYQFRNLPPGRYLVGVNIWGSGPSPGDALRRKPCADDHR
jgi:Carboxypeptidase regulatory-like domain